MEQEQKFSFELPKSDAVNIYIKFAEDGHSLLFTFEDPESEEKKEINISPINNGWISVDDRLPENDNDVLCWYEYITYGTKKHGRNYGICHHWRDIWCGYGLSGNEQEVLYWQPLPKPPKED